MDIARYGLRFFSLAICFPCCFLLIYTKTCNEFANCLMLYRLFKIVKSMPFYTILYNFCGFNFYHNHKINLFSLSGVPNRLSLRSR